MIPQRMKCRSAGEMRDTASHSVQGHAGRERRLGLLGGESRRRATAKTYPSLRSHARCKEALATPHSAWPTSTAVSATSPAAPPETISYSLRSKL